MHHSLPRRIDSLAGQLCRRSRLRKPGSQKVVKLVESDRADRPVPIISLVARQRDLRELVGQHVTGLSDWLLPTYSTTTKDGSASSRWRICNLPAIAGKRILTPINDDAKRAMDDEFARTAQVREEVMNTLLTRARTKGFPQSCTHLGPAPMWKTLVAVSSGSSVSAPGA